MMAVGGAAAQLRPNPIAVVQQNPAAELTRRATALLTTGSESGPTPTATRLERITTAVRSIATVGAVGRTPTA